MRLDSLLGLFFFFFLITEWAVIRLPLFTGVVAVACLSW